MNEIPEIADFLRGLPGFEPLDVLDGIRRCVAQLEDGRAEVDRGAVPPSLRAAVLRTLGFLEPGSLDLLRRASVR